VKAINLALGVRNGADVWRPGLEFQKLFPLKFPVHSTAKLLDTTAIAVVQLKLCIKFKEVEIDWSRLRMPVDNIHGTQKALLH
jgi:hypothetical protein